MRCEQTEFDEFFEVCEGPQDSPGENKKVALAKHKVFSLFQRAYR